MDRLINNHQLIRVVDGCMLYDGILDGRSYAA